jgi:hypothetical protein
MGREPAEALESAITGRGGLESPPIEAGELGPAEPALDVVGGDLGSGGLGGDERDGGPGFDSGEAGPGGDAPGGLTEPGELGPAGLEHGLEPGPVPGGDMWAGNSAGRGPADAIHGPAEAAGDALAAAAAGEPGEAGPADALDGSAGRAFQGTGETAEKGIETAEKDVESVELGLGRDTAQAISAVEAAGEALTSNGAEAIHHAGQTGLGHAVAGREGGSVIEHGVRPGLDRGTGQGTSARDGDRQEQPGARGDGDRQEQSGPREHQER